MAFGDILAGVPKHVQQYMQGARYTKMGERIPRLIPSETASGQIGMFPHGWERGLVPKPTPPFSGGRRVLSRGAAPKARVKKAARVAELDQKAKVAAARSAAKTKRVPGGIYPSRSVPVEGPRTQQQHIVDDLFGVVDRPMQTRYL